MFSRRLSLRTSTKSAMFPLAMVGLAALAIDCGSRPLRSGLSDRLTPGEIEYCGITADGFQTPWLGNQTLCGSRGRAVPMIGCAIRMKPEVAEQYECSYTGQFVSGRIRRPFSNGDICCSDLPHDPLWGIELCVTERREAGAGIWETGSRDSAYRCNPGLM